MSALRVRPGRPVVVMGLRMGLVLATALVAAACTGAGGQGHAGTPNAAKTVELTLIAGKTTVNGGFNFNGFSKGQMTLTVPAGWRVVVHYRNFSPLRHSFDVIPYTGKQPDAPPPPTIFKGATTQDPVSGIGVGKEETITFVADKAGKYEYLCGVAGHAPAGMWNYLVVSATAKAPSVRPAEAATLIVR
jgi:sulfocyanin